MKKTIKLQLEQSEKREKINALLAKDELTDDERAELDTLTKRMQELEVELRAALVLEGESEERARAAFDGTVPNAAPADPEARELARLTEASSIAAIFTATLEHRSTDGETAELQKHYGLSPNQVPLDLMIERRAVTPAPATVGQTQAAIIPGVFPTSVAAFLGIDMPTVGVGEAVFPVLTTSAEVKVPAEGAAAAETTGSFDADALSPGRLQASFFYSREDRARFAGMDAALRQNLSDALSDALDKQVLIGTQGILAGNNIAKIAAAAVSDFATYRKSMVYDRIDGTYASVAGDIRVVMGSATYAHASTIYRANSADDAALDSLMRISGGVRVSAHVTAPANNKQNAVIRRGSRRDMVAPIWEGVTLIPDEVTKAANGQIVVTAVMLHAVKILRASGFSKVESQHA